MSLYILRWNPKISSFTPKFHKMIVKGCEKGERDFQMNWSVREWENLKKNDLFILQMVGTKNDGIAMIGKFRGACYEDENYKYNSGNDPDIRVHYADLIIMSAFDCKKQNPLPADKLEIIFPEIQWHGGHSGVEVPEKIGEKLMSYINGELIKQEIWDEASLQSLIDYESPDQFLDDAFGYQMGGDEANPGTILLQFKKTFFENQTKENFFNLLCCLHDSDIFVPVKVSPDGQTFPIMITNDQGENAFPVFSTIEEAGNEYDSEEDINFVTLQMLVCFTFVSDLEGCSGIVLDPFTQPLVINKELQEYISSINPEPAE